MKKYSFILSCLLGASLFFVACKDDQPEELKSLLEIAGSHAELSTFLVAIDRADLTGNLDGNGSYTVFAPTNAAFAAFLAANGYTQLEDVPIATLKQLLRYHMVIGPLKSDGITAGYVASLANFGTTSSALKLYVENTVNNGINTCLFQLFPIFEN